jgi:hypothetical protein
MAKNIGLFALGLFALPILGLTGVVVSRAALVMGDATSTLQADAEKPAQERQRVASEIHMRPGDIKEFSWQTVLRPDELFPRRNVRVVAYMDYFDIVEKEQRAANPTDQRIFANVFAPKVAKQECERLQQVFAGQCVVERATAEPGQIGRFVVDMTLQFTNKEPFGPPYAAADVATYQEARSPLTPAGGGALIAFSQQESERMDLYRAAARACDNVRRNNGNCAIGDMEVIAKQAVRTSDVLRVEAKTVLLTLQRTASR